VHQARGQAAKPLRHQRRDVLDPRQPHSHLGSPTKLGGVVPNEAGGRDGLHSVQPREPPGGLLPRDEPVGLPQRISVDELDHEHDPFSLDEGGDVPRRIERQVGQHVSVCDDLAQRIDRECGARHGR